MVGAISGTSTLSTSTASGSTSASTDTTTLKAQLATKQSELEQAKTDDEKTTLNAEITTLKAQIAAAKTSETQSSQQASNANPKTDGSGAKRPMWEESRPPEGKISSAVMSVLMQLSQGGIEGSEPPSAADLYTKMDSDKNGSVSKSEFVTARPEHASEEEATSFYNSIDTKGTGSITEQQLADSMQNKGDHGGPDGRRMGPPGGAPDAGSQGVALQQLLASLSASAEAEAKYA